MIVGRTPSLDEIWTHMHAAFDTSNPDTARVALYEWREDHGDAHLLWSEGGTSGTSSWPPHPGLVSAAWADAARAGAPPTGDGRVRLIEGGRARLTPLWGLHGGMLAVLAVDPDPLVVTDADYDELLCHIALTVEEQLHRLERVISHINEVQAELSDSEVRYQSLFENTRDGVLYSAPDGRIHGANPAACAMLGYTEAELLFIHRDDVFFPNDDELAHAVQVRRAAGQYSGELTFRRRDGTALRVDLSSTVFIDTRGRERVVTIFRDVTERRRLEAHAQEMRRMDTLGQLTGGVAHDFNNVLTVIMGAADSLQRGVSSDEALTLAHTIQQASLQAAGLTKQLLAFARRQPLHPLPTDLHGLLAQLEPLLRRALSESVTIRLDRDNQAWTARADPAQLEVAILNLALNARDAMPGGGTLTIGARNHPVLESAEDLAAGDYVELFVRDTGTGMPPDIVSRACEPFFTTKAAGQGTGLGLSMVYGFVRQLGGSLSIESRVGQGTTVRLLLPRETAAPITAAADDPELPRARPGEVVLAVEDSDLLRPLVQAMLTKLGYTVLLASTAVEALDVLGRTPRVDLLFTDVVMPGGIDGRQLSKRVRALRPEVGVLLTSGYMNPHAVGEQGVEPFERLLPKPYQLGPLARAVRAAIDGRDARPT